MRRLLRTRSSAVPAYRSRQRVDPSLLLTRSAFAASAYQRAAYTVHPIERLTTPPSPLLSNTYVDTPETQAVEENAVSAGSSPSAGAAGGRKRGNATGGFRFAVKNTELGSYDHGVTLDAKDFIAEAEAAYRASAALLHGVPGGASLPETNVEVDTQTGQTTTKTRIAAPFSETYVPSSNERFARRQHEGELARQQAVMDKPYMLDEQAQLNLKKERQLTELLDAPMPALEKTEEVAHLLLEGFYPQHLALQPRTGESVMLLYSQASYLQRLNGASNVSSSAEPLQLTATASSAVSAAGCLTVDDIPFLSDMRRLYSHQKQCFVSPTPLVLEHMMATLSVITQPNTPIFHLANRLLVDADKFVLLPTRTTYTAFFQVCHVNNAMPFAMARFTDAARNLALPLDAAMLTSLLKGLNESGYVEEAVALLARVEHVPVSTPLLNAALETLLLSAQSLACFSLYESLRTSSTKPNAETYTLLLLACEKSGQWARVTAILADMQRRQVRGSAQTLNLLLKGLLQERLHSYAAQLYQTMLSKKVPVWPALESGVRQLRLR